MFRLTMFEIEKQQRTKQKVKNGAEKERNTLKSNPRPIEMQKL